VGKSGVKFSMEKLEYFNQMHIRNKFDISSLSSEAQISQTVESWRAQLLENLPENLHPTIQSFDQLRLKKIMTLMTVRIHFYKDLKQHAYFFTDPIYDSEIA
jgi:hypothetical protein